MDNNTENIEKFETILKQHSSRKPLPLYSGKKTPNIPYFDPQKVLDDVSLQVKAFQNADNAKHLRPASKSLHKFKTSMFLPVNMLPGTEETKQHTASFETQCVSDTQLIDVIRDAETRVTHKGMTQEFDNTFCHGDDCNDNIEQENEDIQIEPGFSVIDISLKEPDPNKLSALPQENIEHNENISNFIDTQQSQIVYQVIAVEENIGQDDILIVDKDIPSSPVFSIKQSSKTSKTPSPLVFNLDTFEKFENVAIPLIDDSSDIKMAKQLINSQLLGRELYINTDIDPILKDGDKATNTEQEPITGNYKIEDLILKVTENINECSGNQVNDKSFLEDEILFSSDEEEDYVRKKSQELPFTCALETSFYDQPDVLDKTMYVGFQTANNRSILVNRTSFSKAKSIFDDVDNDIAGNEPTFTELVESWDVTENKTLKNTIEDIKHGSKSDESNNTSAILELTTWNDDIKYEVNKDNEDFTGCKAIDTVITSEALIQDDDAILPNNNFNKLIGIGTKRKYDGFKTASNKRIKLSDEALARSKKILQDINFNENSEIFTEQKIIANTNKITNTITEDFKETLKVTVDNDEHAPSNMNSAVLKEFENTGIDTIQCYDRNDEEIGKSANNNVLKIMNDKNNIQDIELTENTTKDLFESDFEPNNEDVPSNIGFRTASDKKIEISKQALAKTKTIFNDIEFENDQSPSKDIETIKHFETDINEEMLLDIFEEDMPHDIFKEECFAKPSTSNDLTSFKTANNKVIQISEDALIKSKNIFKDIDKIDVDFNKRDNFEGLKTATNKNISKSPKNLAESNRKFEDHLNTDDDEPPFYGFESVDDRNKQTYLDLETKKYVKDNVLGFQTASKKSIQISKEAIAKSRNVFRDIDEEIRKDNSTIKVKAYFQGFKTASNKNIKISDVALAKTKNVFQDIDLNEPPSNSKCTTPAANYQGLSIADDNIKINISDSKFKGFQTASNKPVKISEEALAKSKRILQDEDLFIADDKIKINTSDSKFKGFQTGSNKPVKISEEALSKSKRMLQDEDLFIADDKIRINVPDSKFNSFQTASNKPVDISEEALAKSKHIFQDEDLFVPDEKIKINTSDSKFKGFQTASNKPVAISKEALAKSKQIFQDEYEPMADEKIKSDSKFVGFQTANKKPVQISEQSLAKTKEIFKDVDTVKDIHYTNQNAGFSGFQTASNKEVKISEKALLRSRQIFENIKTDAYINTENAEKCDVMEIDNMQSQILNFKRANNNNVKISKDALKKTKQLSDSDKELARKTGDDLSKINQKNSYPKLDRSFESSTKNATEANMLDTQLLNHFDESLHTEDFLKVTPKQSKRSGSPILSCPKPKRRKKFETPYSQRGGKEKKDAAIITKNPSQKSGTALKFDEHFKKNKKFTLKDVQSIEQQADGSTESDSYIMSFTYENLLQFEFFGDRNEIADTRWTVQDLTKHFVDSVNKKLIPEGWILNHVKLIMWKLISYEIRFPKCLSRVCTVKNVLQQLKYRYNRELYNAERPALRKIMEKDDVSTKTMVLCVAGILVDGCSVISAKSTDNIELLLTDGWYTIKAIIDQMLSQFVYEGKIVVGGKIVTSGAELLNCEQGVSPWEDTSAVRIKLSGNSTSRARWDARLGYHGCAVPVRGSRVRPDGGRVGRLRVLVTRVYPPLYVERFDDGSTVTRSERLEHLHQAEHETNRHAAMEKLYEEVEKEFAGQATPNRSQPTPERSTRQRETLLQDVQKRVEEKMASRGLDSGRNVVPLLKVRVAAVEETGEGVEVTKAMLSIWKPNDAVLELVTEGAWIEVMNVVPTAVRYSEMQISAGRQSIFLQSKYKESEKIQPYTKTLRRTCFTIKDLAKNPSMNTDYNEVDTAGVIFQIDPSKKDFNQQQFQNVYLCDAEKNMICVNFWGGLKKFGFEKVLDTGQIVYGTNLQKRAGNTRRNIPQYRATEFTCFTKTPRYDDGRRLYDELTKQFCCVDKLKFFNDCVEIKNNYCAKQCNNENVSPYRLHNIDMNLSKNKMFADSPLLLPPRKHDDLSLTGLDFESTFKQTDTQELSPKTLLRKRQVQEKIAKLKMYGEPPPLSPLNILNKSKNAGNAYKSPLMSKSDVSNVASEKKILPVVESECSPVLNRTYVKRNVNPVKLNFSTSVAMDENHSEIDHFAEEFDGSPPLSLE